MERERTFIAIKPDGLHRGLVHEVIKRFEQRGFQLTGLKLIRAPIDKLEEHYVEHKGKAFLPSLIEFMASGPLVAMVWQGKDVIHQGRKILGTTRPLEASVGTIRGDFGIDCRYNVAHASDGTKSAEREIRLWFQENELCNWDRCINPWLYE